MIRRVLSIAALALAALLLLSVLLLAWSLGTQSGSRALWRGVSAAVDGLSAQAVDGRFGGPLTLRGVTFESDQLRLVIGELQLDWSPAALLRGELKVERLHVDGADYTQLSAAPEPKETGEFELPERLQLPLAVTLADVALRDLAYRPAPDAEAFRIDEAALAARFRETELSLEKLSANGPLFRVQGSARAETAGDYPLLASLDWQASPPELAPISGELSLEGTLAQLVLEQTLAAPYASAQRIALTDVLDNPQIDARVDLEAVQLAAIAPTLPAGSLSGSLCAEGGIEALSYTSRLALDSADFGAVTLGSAGAYRDEVVVIERLQLSRDRGDGVLKLRGNAALGGAAPQLALDGDWQRLAWPLAGEPAFASDLGRVSIDGTLDEYRVQLSAALAVPGQGEGRLELAGSGNRERFAMETLQLALLDGTLSGSGNLRWQPTLRGELSLEGQGLDPAVVAPAYPGKLALSLRASGGMEDGGLEGKLETLSLSGTFRERPLTLKGEGVYREGRLALDTFRLRAGTTQLNAVGGVGGSTSLEWTLESPDLGDLLPGASGSLSGGGGLSGGGPLPAVTARLEGNAIAYDGYALDQLSLTADVDLERPAPSQLDLTVDGVRLGGVEVRSLSLRGEGQRLDHRLALTLDSEAGAARVELQGGWEETLWRGSVASGELSYGELGAWQLAAPQPLAIGQANQRLERGCWRSGEAALCLQGERREEALDARFSLGGFGLDYLRPVMPPMVVVEGVLEADGTFVQETGGEPEIALAVNASGLAVRGGDTAPAPGQFFLAMEPSSATVNYGRDGLRAALAMPFSEGGGIDASARVGAGEAPLAGRPLTGELELALDELDFFGSLSPEIEAAAGRLSGQWTIAGTLATPVPTGRLRLADAAIELSGPGLAISDIALQLEGGDGGTLDFSGQAQSGGGTLQLAGSARLDGPQTTAELDIDGEAFEVVNTVDARVFLSPDLSVSITEGSVGVEGEVFVPRAAITPKQLPSSAVTASSDQVIIDSDSEAGAEAVAREISAKVRVVLGDAVTVDGFGFKGRLAGALTVDQSPGQPTLGSGEINILDGEYRAYGQGLVIDKGKILFAGGPIDRPGVNIRALRRPAEGITVGVNVRGPLQEPDFALFSEPGMTQSEQLSWLVLGRPLQGASEGESDMIAQAALALGVKGGDFLAKRLGSDLGVDSIGIETGSGEAGAASDVNRAALVIGKYLSPDLYVSYGIGLFDSVSTLRLEYSITDHWRISTESSTLASGGDIHYTIER